MYVLWSGVTGYDKETFDTFPASGIESAKISSLEKDYVISQLTLSR